MAFNGREGLKVRQNDWSTTTGKHLNWIDGGNKTARLSGEEFENLLNRELEHYGLSERVIQVNYYSERDFPAIGSIIERNGKRYKVVDNAVLNTTTAELVK